MTNIPATVHQMPTVPAVTPADMLRYAIDKGADMAQLEKLMDMKERWDANEAKKAFIAAMMAFKASPPKLERDKKIKHGEKLISKYAGLDQVSSVVGKALSEHGISHSWAVEQDDKAIRVSCVLTHEAGHSERVTMQAGADTSGAKNSIQAIGSTITYLQRYTLLSATGLAVKDKDDDGVKGGADEPISAEQKDEIITLIKETASDTAKFLAHMRIPALDDLPASRFEEAKAALEKKRGKK